MVLTFGDVRNWNADAVDEAGDVVRKHKDSLLRLEDDLAATAVGWRWTGDAANAARGTIGKLNDRAEHLVAEAGSVQRALYDASDGIRVLQHAVKDADAKAAANQFTITADGGIRDDAPPLPAPRPRFEAEEMAQIQQHRTRIRDELLDEIQRILAQADEIDRALAGVLARAAAGEISDDGATSLTEADENVDRRRELDEILATYQVDPDPDGLVKYPRNWLLRQVLGERTVTATEADLLDELGLGGLDDFKGIHDDAFDAADEHFPSHNGDRNDDHNDAFRHAYWNALLVSEYGAEWAERYGTAHESIPGNQPEREAMDLYNNEVGRRIAVENPDADREELADLVAEAVRNGETVVIPEGGGLAFSDQVEPHQTGEPALPAPEQGENPDSDSTGSGEYGSGS